MLDGEPYRRMLERNGQPLSPAEQRKEQEKLDKNVARLAHETPEQKQQRLAEYEKRRRKEREFLREIPDAYDFRIEGDAQVDGHDVWVIAGTPKAGYHARGQGCQGLARRYAERCGSISRITSGSGWKPKLPAPSHSGCSWPA